MQQGWWPRRKGCPGSPLCTLRHCSSPHTIRHLFLDYRGSQRGCASSAQTSGGHSDILLIGQPDGLLDLGIVSGKRLAWLLFEASTRLPKAIRPYCIWPSFRNGLPTNNTIGH